MRVGTITFHHADNYGAVLQAYALQQALLSLGVETELIDYDCPAISDGYHVAHWNGSLRGFILSLLWGRDIRRKNALFEHFRRQYLRLSPVVTKSELPALVQRYDAVITGSDQVWNHALVHGDAAYFLDFVPPEKRCSYAASFGISEIPEEERSFYQEHLQGYHNYSTREATGARLVQELTGQQATVDLDPVFLPGVSRWEQLLQPIERRPYIFLYMPLDASLAVARQLAAQQHLDIVYVAYNKSIRHPERNPGDCRIAVAPEEFLSLLYHAQCVVTGSFHATVFSVLFHKPFYTSVPERIGSRITDVLHLLSLSDHIIQHGQVPSASEPDWGRVDARVTALRTESLQHLKESLGLA